MQIVFGLIPNLIKVGGKFVKLTLKLLVFWGGFFVGGEGGGCEIDPINQLPAFPASHFLNFL